MQYVNDDMDELFRRAAEHYPLDTNSADWSKVMAALQNVETAPAGKVKGKSNSRLLWLLLLLPLGFICNQLSTPGVDSEKSQSVSQAEKQQGNTQTSADKQTSTADQTISANDQTTAADKNENSDKVTITAGDKETTTANVTPQQSAVTLQKNKNRPSGREVLKKSTDYPYTPSQQAQTINRAVSEDPFAEEGNVAFRKFIFHVSRDKAAKNSIAVNRPLTPVENLNSNRKKPYQKGAKGFYFGLMGGIDFTTVKFQKFEEKGFTRGIVAGYQLNKNLSIETGVFRENKYYYSDGKYFNTSKIYMPPNSEITEVSGECNMYEIPVSVKYNFSPGKNTWFVSAGSSSYIMKQEDYNYTYYYGSSGPYPRYKQYLNSSKNFFATANISGGYIQNIGNFADLRIEPYFKVPLAGLGIGKLPLLSTGVNIGVTKKF